MSPYPFRNPVRHPIQYFQVVCSEFFQHKGQSLDAPGPLVDFFRGLIVPYFTVGIFQELVQPVPNLASLDQAGHLAGILFEYSNHLTRRNVACIIW